MKDLLNKYVFNKSFLLGVVICIGVLSKYIFGNDNLIEEASEFVIKTLIGLNIDLSSGS